MTSQSYYFLQQILNKEKKRESIIVTVLERWSDIMSSNAFVKIASMRKAKLLLNDLEVENYSYMNVTDILYIIYLALIFAKSRGH